MSQTRTELCSEGLRSDQSISLHKQKRPNPPGRSPVLSHLEEQYNTTSTFRSQVPATMYRILENSIVISRTQQKGERRKFSKGIYAQEYVEEKCAPAARSRWNIELTLLTGIYSSVATDVFRGSFRVRGTGSRGEFALPWKNLIAWVNPTTLVHSLEAAEWKKNCSGVQFMFCLLLLVTWKSCW